MRFSAQSPTQLTDNREHVDPGWYKQSLPSYGQTGIRPEDVKMELRFANAKVITGSFDTKQVRQELKDDNNGNTHEYEEDGEHAGFTEFVRANQDTSADAWGVAGGKLVHADRIRGSTYSGQDAVAATDVLEGIVDAKHGDGKRYAAESEDFSTLVNHLGSGTFLFGSTRSEAVGADQADAESGSFEGTVAGGTALAINGEKSQYKEVYVFEDTDAVDTGDVEDYVEANDVGSRTLAKLDDPSVNQKGRAVVVSGSAPIYRLSLSS
ncbi:MAG: hypothetical protein ABEJ31_11630 [Haloarculaceae archaeon]